MNRKDFIKYSGLAALFFGMKHLKELHRYSEDLAFTEKMPALFLGHGSPMNAIEDNQFVQGFREIAETIPMKPKAILCVSAHWLTQGTKVTAMEMPKTIHDFGGFPEILYQVQYPAKGSPDLATQTKELLSPTSVELDHDWGLDHGAWSVIKHLYPAADIPVIQMSIDYNKPASYHFELAKRLRSLREKGILIIGSGNIVHNLRRVDWANFDKDNHGFDWAVEARNTINTHMQNGDFEQLFDYHKNESLKLAIPTPDHYFPLLYSLGLKDEREELSLFNDKMLAGSLSMTSVKIG